jgi:hypothetical protein
MSDTGLGLTVAVTRQKDGKPVIAFAPGGVKLPATVAADVIVVFGNARNVELVSKLEHMSTAAGTAPTPTATAATNKTAESAT